MILVLGVSMASAACAVWFLNRSKTTDVYPFLEQAEPISFLFDDGVLHHGTGPALAQLALQPGTHVWDDMRDTLVSRFPDIPDRAGTGQHGSLTIYAADQQSRDQLEIAWRGPMGRRLSRIKGFFPKAIRTHQRGYHCALNRTSGQIGMSCP